MKREFDFLKGLIFDIDRKSYTEIFKDLKQLRIGRNFLNITNYFQSMMYKKDAGNLSDYFDGLKMHKIILNDDKRGKHDLLEDKIAFARFMFNNDMPIAFPIGEIIKGEIIIDEVGRASLKNNEESFNIINKVLDNYGTVFIKQIDALGGNGVFRVETIDDLDLNKISSFENYIIEKGIIQHKDLNKINDSRINSLRVMTLRIDNKIVIPSCFFRFGRKHSYVDNAAAGGLFTDYNIEANILGEYAYSHAGSGGKSYLKHPDSQYVFFNQNLPYPDKIKDLAIKCAELIPDLDLIGWDIAFTDDGPVVIEGNSNPSLLMMQVTQKGLYRNTYYKEYYKDL